VSGDAAPHRLRARRQPQTSEQLRVWAPSLFVFSAIALVLFVLAPPGTAKDFAVFYRAGGRWLRGENLYQLSDGVQCFKYAPIFATFLAPFSLLPQRLGWLALNGLSIAALLAVMAWAAERLRIVPGLWRQALVLAMAAPWYGHLLWLGQSDGVVLWLLADSERRCDRQPVVSGLLWALACLVKPPFLSLLLVAVPLRQWRRMSGLALGLIAWPVLGALRFGVEGGWTQLQGWLELLSESTGPLICWKYNQSAFAVVCTYLAPVGTPQFLLALAGIAAAVIAGGSAAVWLVYRTDPRRGRLALGGLALYLGAFLSPLGWNTNLIAALPLAWVLAAVATEGAGPLRRVATCAALLVALLNCVDLLLLPVHLWEDTMSTLLWYRQYAIAALWLVVASLGGLALQAITLRAGPHHAAPPP
jgi:hypothetical protein